MAITKIDANSFDLTDDYAFTGTISGAGGLVKLHTTSISASATSVSIDGYFSSSYKTYIFEYYDFEMTSSSNNEPRLRFNFSGTAYNTSNYRSIAGGTVTASDNNGSATNSAAWGNNFISMNAGQNYPQDGSAGAVGKIIFYNPQSTSNYKTVEGTAGYLSATKVVTHNFSGTLAANASTACSGITLFCTSGSFASGTIRLFGVV